MHPSGACLVSVTRLSHLIFLAPRFASGSDCYLTDISDMISIPAGQDSSTNAIARLQHHHFTTVAVQDGRGTKT
jgi:hypothetical protein